ncbi:hypothetical protein F0562_009261 [Nyssa sinensis]|uniref:Protein kinase domain-containing protein n=1 Tax=Nyssa sinensis TaxID=561372 RepID=A0A5J4ZYM3_9ASTE|nr:hypothetical protein F0562_009261 [Nyssa sinensis]
MPSCRKKKNYHFVILPILLSLFAMLILCMFGYPLVVKSKLRRQLAIFNGGDLEDEQERKELKYPRLSHRQLVEATGGFSSSSLVGSGWQMMVMRMLLSMIQASFNSTDGLLCGSVGYIAPEYGMGKRASTQGDVYSFGVLLLEIVTGKRPTDVLFHEGSSLHEWIKSHYPHRLEPIVEEALVRRAPPATMAYNRKIWCDVILEMIELGLMCTQYTASTRPTMLDVAQEMARLKQYLSSPSALLIKEASAKVTAI